jgi:hypothetical protein
MADAVALTREKVARQDAGSRDFRWLRRLVELLAGQGDFGGVLAFVQQTLEQYDEATVRADIGRRAMAVLTAAGAEEAALAVGHLLLEVVEPHDALISIYRSLMQLYIGMGNRAQAIVLGYESLGCLSPDHNGSRIYGETMRLLVDAGFPEDAFRLGESIMQILASSPAVGTIYHSSMELLATTGDAASARDLGWRAAATLNAEQGKGLLYRDLLYLLAHERDMDALQKCEDEAFAVLPPGDPTITFCSAVSQVALALHGRRAGIDKILDICRRIQPDDAAEVIPNGFFLASALGEWDVIDHIDDIVPDEMEAKRLKTLAAVIRTQSAGDHIGALKLAAEARNGGWWDRRVRLREIFSLCCCGQAETAAQFFSSSDSTRTRTTAKNRVHLAGCLRLLGGG